MRHRFKHPFRGAECESRNANCETYITSQLAFRLSHFILKYDYISVIHYCITMEIEIINRGLILNISGFSGVAANKDYSCTALVLMDKTWPVIKSKGLKHKGLNIWVYEADEKVFAGVELEDRSIEDTGLEQKIISLKKYAYHKHIGPYRLLKQAGEDMQSELDKIGLRARYPFIEIYGHWTNDESKLETEILIQVE